MSVQRPKGAEIKLFSFFLPNGFVTSYSLSSRIIKHLFKYTEINS